MSTAVPLSTATRGFNEHKGSEAQMALVPPSTTPQVELVPYQSHPFRGWDCGTNHR